MYTEMGTTPSMPMICGHQHHKVSIPASNPSIYFWRTKIVPFLDHLLSELDKRFSSHQNTAFQGQYLVPSMLLTENPATVSCLVMKVGKLYSVDLPNVSSLSGEIHNWYTKWKSEEKDHSSNSLLSTLFSTLTGISSFYPNIKAFVTLCALPVNSCTAER